MHILSIVSSRSSQMCRLFESWIELVLLAQIDPPVSLSFDLVTFVEATYVLSLRYGKQTLRFQELYAPRLLRELKKHRAELDTWCSSFSIAMTAWQEGYWRKRKRELLQIDELAGCRNYGMTKQCSKLQTSEWSRWLFWCRAEYRRRIHANIIQSCKDGKRVKGMSEGHMHWS